MLKFESASFIVTACLLAALCIAGTAFAGGVSLYEDSETGQIFTRPGAGRVAVDDGAIPPSVASRLYEDPETGAVYAKPGAGRVALAAPASPAPASNTVTAESEERVADKVMSRLPSWLRTVKLKGDLRLRYDFMRTVGKETRNRGRYRVRLGLEAPVNDQVSLHFMMASGGDDPKSANQTFGPSFEAPDFRLREAYAQYDPFGWLSVRGGQMENVLWRSSDGVWDKDIKPTGGGFMAHYENTSIAEPFINGAVYIIQHEKSTTDDPYMWVAQPGVKLGITKDVSLKLAAALYGYESVKNAALAHTAGSNTTMNVGTAAKPVNVLVYDYDGVVASAQLDVKDPLSFMPLFSLFGEYAYNPDPGVLNQGYIVGTTIGHKKVNKGGWQAMYSWRRMERDAVLDILPDSDAFSGRTNVTGHEVVLKYGLLDNVEFGLDYYRMRDITTNIDEDRVQADFVFSFPRK